MTERGRDQCLRRVNFLLSDVVKHSFEFHHKVQRGQRASAELVFGINFVESAGAEAKADSRIEIGSSYFLYAMVY